MILVTGASGLLGLHLIKKLSQQQLAVRAGYRNQQPQFISGTVATNIEWQYCDILDFESLEKCFEDVTHVYHCAATVSYDSRFFDSMMDVNIEGTANVVNFCLEKKIEKLIFVSSIAAIGKEDPPTLITEKTMWNSTDHTFTHYGLSKQKAEMEVWRGIAEGLNAAIINPSVILGEGDMGKSSTNLFKIVYDEFPFFTSGATGWVDVRDVVNAMVMLMQSELTNERFIISAGNFSYKHIFEKMAKAMGKKPPSRYAPPWLTALVWRVSYLRALISGKQATITRETARSAHETNQYDNSKFCRFFPEFTYNELDETIDRVSNALFAGTP